MLSVLETVNQTTSGITPYLNIVGEKLGKFSPDLLRQMTEAVGSAALSREAILVYLIGALTVSGLLVSFISGNLDSSN